MDGDPAVSASLSTSVATFAAGMSKEEKQDVSDLLLQADIFASKTWDRKQYWKSWVDYHRNRMEKHGCTRQGVIINQPMFVASLAELDSPFILRMQGVHSLQLVEMVLAALNETGYYYFARAFLERGSENSHLGNFQVAPCFKNATGEVHILVCGLHVTGHIDGDRRELVLRLNGGEYLFSTALFDHHREQVRRDVARYASQRVKHIGF